MRAAICVLLGSSVSLAVPAGEPHPLHYNGGPRHTGVYDTAPLQGSPELKWKFETAGEVTSPPLVHEGVVYFGDWKDHFYAVDVESGKELWRLSGVEAGAGPPTIWKGQAYWGGREGTFYALDAKTGAVAWEFETGGGAKDDEISIEPPFTRRRDPTTGLYENVPR